LKKSDKYCSTAPYTLCLKQPWCNAGQQRR